MILLLAAPVAPTVALLTTGGSTVLAMAVVPLAVAARVTPTVAEPRQCQQQVPEGQLKGGSSLDSLGDTLSLLLLLAAQCPGGRRAPLSAFCSFSPVHVCVPIPALIPLCWKGLVTE